jgi:colanic acid biosynthesis glycosyl transferase WcaI
MVLGLIERPPNLVVAQTDPPVVGLVGLLVARRFRVPLVVIVQDLLPSERHSVSANVIRPAVDLYLRRAEHVVAVGETMRRRLEDRGIERVTVIPNWVDTQALHPVEKDFGGRFVVMHSGNIGYGQDLETLISAARQVPDVEVVIAGAGARRGELERAASGIPNLTFRGYVPEEQLSESLSSASLHFVGLSAGLSGYAVPSRLYSVLAAGRPVLVTADEDSEAAELVHRVGCGFVLPPGRPHELAEVIRGVSSGTYDLRGMGARGRRFAVSYADRSLAVARYRQLFANVLAESYDR